MDFSPGALRSCRCTQSFCREFQSPNKGNRMPAKNWFAEKEIFRKHFQKAGLKRSSQRDLILEVFLDTKGHFSSEELYRLVKRKDSSIGFTTVYRTLKLLTESGLAQQVNFGDGRTRYERNYQGRHHDHLICVECGTLIEFYSEAIENMQDRIADSYQFRPTHHSLRIFGLCANCQKAAQKKENRQARK